MKRYRLPLLAVIGGAIGFLLRLWQNAAAFEAETGLPLPHALPSVLLPVFLALAALAVGVTAHALPNAPQDADFPAFFASSGKKPLALTVTGVFLLALSGVWDLFLSSGGTGVLSVGGISGRIGVSTLFGALSLAAAACLFSVLPLCRRESAVPAGRALALLAVPVLFIVRLIAFYRTCSVDPVLAGYYVELLAVVFLTLAFYRLSGFSVRAGSARFFSAYAAIAVILCFTRAADGLSSSALFALGGGLTLLGFLLLHLAADAEAAP